MSFLSSAGDTTQQTVSGAYAPATPALGQILTEATNIYNQGMPTTISYFNWRIFKSFFISHVTTIW